MSPDEIASVGADVDVKALMDEIRGEVNRKREAGVYPPEIADELDLRSSSPTSPEAFKAGISNLRSVIPFSIEPRITSSRPSLTPVIVRVKRTIHRGVSWYIANIVDQINWFASRSIRMFEQIIERSDALEKRVSELESEIEAIRNRGQRN